MTQDVLQGSVTITDNKISRGHCYQLWVSTGLAKTQEGNDSDVSKGASVRRIVNLPVYTHGWTSLRQWYTP